MLGWSFSEIGTRLGIAESTAQAIWQREVERFPPLPTREKMRTISGRRLNKARVHAFNLTSSDDPKTKARGISALVQIETREARLFGLDAAVQSQVEEGVTRNPDGSIRITLEWARADDWPGRCRSPVTPI